MSDNKHPRDNADRNPSAGHQPYEFGYLQEKFGVTRVQVERAIRAVGNDRPKLEEYLRGLEKSGNPRKSAGSSKSAASDRTSRRHTDYL